MPIQPSSFAPLNTVDEIKRQHEYFSSHWFEPDTMRFFKSRLLHANCYPSEKQRCTYFVTSEQGPNGIRAYSIRKALWDSVSIKPVGDFQQYRTARDAWNNAKFLAEAI
jgi:hypothetical protein